jgi:hypothetical protein
MCCKQPNYWSDMSTASDPMTRMVQWKTRSLQQPEHCLVRGSQRSWLSCGLLIQIQIQRSCETLAITATYNLCYINLFVSSLPIFKILIISRKNLDVKLVMRYMYKHHLQVVYINWFCNGFISHPTYISSKDTFINFSLSFK